MNGFEDRAEAGDMPIQRARCAACGRHVWVLKAAMERALAIAAERGGRWTIAVFCRDEEKVTQEPDERVNVLEKEEP